MKVSKFLLTVFLGIYCTNQGQAQIITIAKTPSNGCSTGSVSVVANASPELSGTWPSGYEWSMTELDLTWCREDSYPNCPWDNSKLQYTFYESGVYYFKAIYNNSGTYYSHPFSISAGVQSNQVVCGDFNNEPYTSILPQWYNSLDYITTCSSGVHVYGLESTTYHSQLSLKAPNAITLNPGFLAERGSIVDVRIGDPCAANTDPSPNLWYSYPAREGSLNYIAESQNVVVSPNPNSGSFLLSLYYLQPKNVDIKVLDVTGTEVYNNKLGYTDTVNLNINLSDKEPGVYFVKIISDAGIEVRKVVVER